MPKVNGLWSMVGAAAVGMSAMSAQAQTTCGRQIGPAIIVGDITGPTNYTAAGGLDAFSLGTVSCNPGSADVQWVSSTTQHPVVGQNLFKLKRVTVGSASYQTFEQLGQSWLKHTFLALTQNLCCSCNGHGGAVLGVGCSDPYTSSRNGSQGGLGPKWQVNAHTGAFAYPFASPGFQTSANVARRLIVSSADLEASSADVQYVVDCQYVSPDSAAAGNQNIASSHRPATVTGGPSEFNMSSFSAGGPTVRERPAIYYWKTIDPTVTLTAMDTPGRPSGTERLYVASKATNLNNGTWHYEYAIYNQNSDECVGKFSVPIPDSATVTNVGFKGVVYRDGDGINNVNFDSTAWPSTRSNNAISWSTTPFASNANGNAIRWGTMYTVRFDANVPPTSGNATLSTWKTVANYPAAAQVPSGGPATCYADCDGNNTLNVNDFVCFQTNFSGGAPSADCDHNSSLNVNDFVCFQQAFATGCP